MSWQDDASIPTPGEGSADETASRAVLPERTRAFIELAALLSLSRIEEFEASAQEKIAAGVEATEIFDLLLELADIGVRVPHRAFRFVRELD